MKLETIKSYDVCIIGGGASGLFCAATINKNNPDIKVAVLEKQKDIGKKLLATGNGRCNLTNLYAETNMYHGTFKVGAINSLNTCPPELLIELFKDFGLLTVSDNEGRVYPYSKHSSSVLDCLRINCSTRNVDIICESRIVDIAKTNDIFTITDENKIHYICKTLVVASGSRATPETGADDTILRIIADKFKHTTTQFFPALCPITVKSKLLHSLKGVRANGVAGIYVDGNLKKEEIGEIQFTDKTLSGICIFNMSRIANTSENAFIRLSLLPHMNEYSIYNLFLDKINSLLSDSPAEHLLCGIFQRKLVCALLKQAGIQNDKIISSINKNELRKLAHIINNWDFPVIPSKDFTRAQVVAGGINGKEINCKTMESKIINNLYFIGEATDCDGDCGGLNLQFAFSSAYCAAGDIIK